NAQTRSVFVNALRLVAANPFFSIQALEIVLEFSHALDWDHDCKGPTQDFLRCVAVEHLSALIPAGDDSIDGETDDCVFGRSHDGRELLANFISLSFGARTLAREPRDQN